MDRGPIFDLALALLVVAVWGSNFVVIRIGLDHLPPLLFAALRFGLTATLAAVVPRPRIDLTSLAAYGLLIGAGQFGLLFIAMRGHISPGLASLVVQMQVFFTIGLSVWWMGERVRRVQVLALAVAASGILVIALNSDGATTPLGVALVLVAGLCWAGGNVVAKASGARNLLPVVIWGSLFSFPPLVLLSAVFEGWPAIRDGLARADAATWAAVL